MGKDKKKTQNCRHRWAPLLAKAGKKTVSTSLFTCLKCGDLKVGIQTIRISRFRLDMDQKPIVNLVIENRTSDPASPASGRLWLRTDL